MPSDRQGVTRSEFDAFLKTFQVEAAWKKSFTPWIVSLVVIQAALMAATWYLKWPMTVLFVVFFLGVAITMVAMLVTQPRVDKTALTMRFPCQACGVEIVLSRVGLSDFARVRLQAGECWSCGTSFTAEPQRSAIL